MAKKKKEVKKPPVEKDTKKPTTTFDKDEVLKVNTSFENLLGMMANTPPQKEK